MDDIYHIANLRLDSNSVPCRRYAGKETDDGKNVGISWKPRMGYQWSSNKQCTTRSK